MKLIVTVILMITFSLSVAAQEGQGGKPESRFAKLDQLRVHYENFGRGDEALIFVHGWSSNVKFWRANIPALSKQSRVIAIDLPGHGESDKPQITYSMDLFARAINAVMTDAGVERAVLAGHSMGVAVIRQFYRKYPGKTRALVMVDFPLRPFATPEQMEQYVAQFRAPDYKRAMEAFIDAIHQQMKDRKTVEEIKSWVIATPQHVVVGAWEAMMDPAIWTPDSIQVPALAIMASSDRLTPEYVKFAHELVPSLDYQVWEGVSHTLMMDEPQKFNESVAAFLKKNRLLR